MDWDNNRIESLLAAAVADSPGQGLAIGVTVGKTTAFTCSGQVLGTPVGQDTVMYGASVAKQMVGFLLAQAVESGLADEEHRVSTWLPELPE
jgi:CubicO group peptidase (beta-lactamase class C family)